MLFVALSRLDSSSLASFNINMQPMQAFTAASDPYQTSRCAAAGNLGIGIVSTGGTVKIKHRIMYIYGIRTKGLAWL